MLEKLKKENERLKKELARFKILENILPICAKCKSIRDDANKWHQIEEYIRSHTGAEFSHSVCPECAKELYPDLDLD